MSRAGAAAHVPRALPSCVVHVGVAVVAVTLSVMIIPTRFWLIVALVLSIAAAAVPRVYSAWGLAVLLALYQLSFEPSAAGWRTYTLLAGIHLLHVLAALSLVVPLRGRIDARVFLRVLRRYAVVQLPCQALLVIVLAVVSPASASIALPWLAPVAALLLIVLTAALISPFARNPR
ncbi:hypothetical protein [Paramicrobacterium agarici]|uniref:hypothetical protein n=1 Tax=Paramicrobacterium agarici TaxID=630514 RepID=UPI001152388A|nr:hypothetical protein [Microbacterium agarici]TQO21243.1 hypothetical protein FB385_0040 [Microbacterium agarici]